MLLPDMIDYIFPRVHIVLCCIPSNMGLFEYNLYTDLIPDPSKKDGTLEYLLDKNTGVLLEEMEDGSQNYIGIWNPIELMIDRDEEMPDLGEDEIEMDILTMYTIEDRIYYELTEIV